MNRVAFEVLGHPIYWYGVMFVLGILAGVWSGSLRARLTQVSPKEFQDSIPWIVGGALKVLAESKDPYAQYYAEPFIEIPLEDLKAKTVKPPPRIVVAEVDRVASYHPAPGFLSAWLTPAGLLILVSLYAGNLVAGYSIARFRRKQPALVCGISAILPVVGPAIFMVQPEQAPAPVEVFEEELTDQPEAKELVASTGASALTKTMTRAATVKDSAAAGYEPAIYKKGDITFNRRFFETKFPTFFRPVLGQKEKTVMFVINEGGKFHEGIRFSRVTTGEIYLVPMAGVGEISISIAAIDSVEVKPR
jgi:hypothetical protein